MNSLLNIDFIQCEIINKSIIQNKIFVYGQYAVIPMEYDKYTSILTIKRANVLAEVIKSHGVNLLNMTPYNKCTASK